MNDGLLGDMGKIFSGVFGGVGGLYSVRFFIVWLTARHDTRAKELAAERAALDAKEDALEQRWGAYTKRVEARLQLFEDALAACEEAKHKLEDEKHRLETIVARQEGYATGMGDQRQETQILRAAEAVDRSNVPPEMGNVGTN